MTTFRDMYNRFKSFDLTEATGESMVENKDEVLQVNKDQLYERGEGKDGQPLTYYRSKSYADKKFKMRGQRIVDGYLTGEMQSKMTLRVENGQYEVFSAAPHTQYFVKDRPKAFGFTDEGRKTTWYIIRPGVVERLKEHTGTN